MELEQNNLEIEKRFTEITKEEISNGIKEIDQQINSEKEVIGIKFFGDFCIEIYFLEKFQKVT